MQIEEKYKKNYRESLKKIKKERERFMSELSSIDVLRIIPTQANYIMAEIIGDMSSRDFVKQLLVKKNILIKDLSGKLNGKNYIRIAVRDEKDNNIFLKAVRDIC